MFPTDWIRLLNVAYFLLAGFFTERLLLTAFLTAMFRTGWISLNIVFAADCIFLTGMFPVDTALVSLVFLLLTAF